jgi:aspartate dehydrogenase
MKPPARIVLLGFGAINQRVAQLLRTRGSKVDIAGIIVRRSASYDIEGAARIEHPAELAALKPDFVVEAATREAVRAWGEPALRSARRFVVSSGSALADDELLRKLRETAQQCGSQLVLSPGALAGIDGLAAAARLPLREVCHRIIKSPASWGTAVGPEALSAATNDPIVLFRGSAREAASRYPLNANVTIVSALSGMGLDATTVELICDPLAVSNRHEIQATGDFGSLLVRLQNRPLQSNPKSSELAALSLVRLLENETSDLVL